MEFDDLFLEKTPSLVIPDFPYVRRNCPYCERQLKIFKAIHLVEEKEHYKAVMICDNPDCGAYDEDAGQAYVRVYYSSQHAFDKLELVLGIDPRKMYGDKFEKK